PARPRPQGRAAAADARDRDLDVRRPGPGDHPHQLARLLPRLRSRSAAGRTDRRAAPRRAALRRLRRGQGPPRRDGRRVPGEPGQRDQPAADLHARSEQRPARAELFRGLTMPAAALLIIDMLSDFLDRWPAGERQTLVANTNALVALFRERSLP